MVPYIWTITLPLTTALRSEPTVLKMSQDLG